jgi:hypothetical protein
VSGKVHSDPGNFVQFISTKIDILPKISSFDYGIACLVIRILEIQLYICYPLFVSFRMTSKLSISEMVTKTPKS